MKSEPAGDITDLLNQWHEDRASGLEDVMDKVYGEFRRIAKRLLRDETPSVLQTTALINEAYLRLNDLTRMRFHNRNHFFWFAGQLMRRVLVEQARAKGRKKRGENPKATPFEEAIFSPDPPALDHETILAVDASLNRLKTIDSRQCQIVELRYFAGMNVNDIGEAMALSPATVKRDWRLAKLWLAKDLATVRAGNAEP